MANNYYGRAAAFEDPKFRMAVSFCARNAAQLILADGGASTGSRLAMAEALAKDDFIMDDYRANEANQLFALGILSNVTIAASLINEAGEYDLSGTSASDFEFDVASNWDTIAEALYPVSEPDPA